MKAVVIQMNVGTDKAANLRKAADLIDKACEVKAPDLIMLPPHRAARLGRGLSRRRLLSDAEGQGRVSQGLHSRRLAQ